MNVQLRKMQLTTERVHHVGGDVADAPLWRGAIAAVMANPFVGRVPEDLDSWTDALAPFAVSMAEELCEALVAEDRQIESYGKGATVGSLGEIEIAAAWHVPGGAGLRAALGGPKAQVPSSKKVGALGCQLDIPLVHLHASYLRSHYDAFPVVVADGPRPNEVVYALVMSTGPRLDHRIGGFTKDEIVGSDGQR